MMIPNKKRKFEKVSSERKRNILRIKTGENTDNPHIIEYLIRNDAAKRKKLRKIARTKQKNEQKFAVDGADWSTASSICQRKTDTFYIETVKSPQTRGKFVRGDFVL